MTIAQMMTFFDEAFPQASFTILSLDEREVCIKKEVDERHLRPGGTVSGPLLMEVADLALYVAVLNEIGLVALAVTTNLNINFLNKPAAGRPIVAECKLIKVGKTLIMGEVFMYSEGNNDPVAHATGTYSVPPAKIQ